MVLSCIGALCALPAPCSAAFDTAAAPGVGTVDYSALLRDLALSRNADGRMTMAIWMPDIFWRAALQNSGRLTDKAIGDYVAIMHPYTLIAVLDAQRGITAFHFTDLDTLLTDVTIEDSHGATYSALPPDSVAEDIRNLIQVMRPLLSNTMGAMGQHMEILVFPSADKTGNLIADPKSDGSLTVHLGNIALHYRLPLGSILPPSLDPKTGESFPGNYYFNPYTGSKLVQRPTDTHTGSAPKPQ